MRSPHTYYILIILGILIVGFMQYADQIELIQQVATEKQNVKNAQEQIAKKVLDIEKLKIDKYGLETKVDCLTIEIRKSKNRIAEIQKQKNEKVLLVDDLTPSQLQEFFTKRYAAKASGKTN